jgi:hypothetical protein
MPVYECEHCGHQTKIRSRMEQHFKKKKLCTNEVVVVNYELLRLIKQGGIEILKLERDLLDTTLFL